MSELHDTGLHEIARTLCFLKHGDWRYDPGNPKYDKWFKRAEDFATVAGLRTERRLLSDGAGSWPPSSHDRPQTRLERIAGPWRIVPSPARDLSTATNQEAAS